ncbi:hypothetical protein NONI108955_23490 [Nocardia ninae]|uniref:Uncharacterized protein n=1 Tax=Nocardia ninae NBRC 108245 TaxID=1210091 RepID=A0A511MGZ2_9NOCA|nr:hypothetical protein [Nocardia ninae]GEM39924.1 hypothetical protein NN4_44430 [Nocardia ninae NBRC 108245]
MIAPGYVPPLQFLAIQQRQILDTAIAWQVQRTRCEVLLRGNGVTIVRQPGPRPNHLLHAGITILTRGLWVQIWIARIYALRPTTLRLAIDDDGVIRGRPSADSCQILFSGSEFRFSGLRLCSPSQAVYGSAVSR